MPRKKEPEELSRRERQIMDIIYERQAASANDVIEAMADPPSYSAIRALLAILERKGLVRHMVDARKYVYTATRPRDQAGRNALQRVMRTFYDGSLEKAVAAVLDTGDAGLTSEELDRLRAMIDEARKEGR